MDRLSAYAAREAETEAPEDRQQAETEATANLLEKLKLAKEAKPTEEEATDENKQNGHSAEEEAKPESTGEDASADKPDAKEPAAESNGEVTKSRGIPDNVRLFEVFHEQVIHLVNMQRLPIADITALLVSLINLAL